MDAARRAKFENLLNETREDVKQLEEEMEIILAEVKQRLADLQTEKEAQLTVYEGYCRLLGVENDLEADGDEDDLED